MMLYRINTLPESSMGCNCGACDAPGRCPTCHDRPRFTQWESDCCLAAPVSELTPTYELTFIGKCRQCRHEATFYREVAKCPDCGRKNP